MLYFGIGQIDQLLIQVRHRIDDQRFDQLAITHERLPRIFGKNKPGAALDPTVQVARTGVDVAEWQHHQPHFVAAAHGFGQGNRVGDNVPLRQHHAARIAGGAGRVKDGRQRFWSTDGVRGNVLADAFDRPPAQLDSIRVATELHNMPCAAVGNQLFLLGAAQRGVQRHMHRAQVMQCQVVHHPLHAVGANLHHQVAALDALLGKLARPRLDGTGNVFPRVPRHFAVHNRGQRGLMSAAADRRDK